MRFELDEILIDSIIFSMEDQDGDSLLDTQEREIVDIYNNELDEDTDFESDRFISLPEWTSADGYRLMERFAAGLKKPVLREELSSALNRSRGVFRAFRDVLSQYPESEKQWFQFKEREMKNEVIAWYNSLREEWGLEPIGIEPEDTSSLVMEDFVIREQGTGNREQREISFIAETAGGDYAGVISAKIENDVLHINKLEVQEEFRGMGLGKTLLEKLLEKADQQKIDVTIDLPFESDFFSRSLHLANFKPLMRRFVRKS